MEQKNINYLILAFVFLIVGAALITAIASNTADRTEKDTVYDESNDLATACVYDIAGDFNFVIGESNASCNITVTNYPSGWKTDDCPLTSVVVGNSTLDFTEGTGYNVFLPTGLIQMLNSTETSNGHANTTLVDYTYCADDYLNSSWGRSVLNTVPGFFALALLGVALWLFYSVFKDIGIIGKR